MADVVDAVFGRLIGGRVCIDFVNTVGARIGGEAEGEAVRRPHEVVDDRLTSYDALLRWGVLAGALKWPDAAALGREAAARPRAARAVLRRALTLREATYRVLIAVLDDTAPRPRDMVVLNRELAVARPRQRLLARPAFGWAWERSPGALDRPLWPVAADAADLLVDGDLSRLGQCAGPHCGWLYLDTSRSRRRQWCDMATCGNVAKVRRFRARQAEGG